MSCRELFVHYPVRAILSTIFGGLVGLLIASIIWTYESQPAPSNPVLQGAPVVTILPDGIRAIRLNYYLAEPGECLRTGFYTMYRVLPDGTTLRHPLGGFMNGAVFAAKPAEYVVEFYLPAGTPAGEAFVRLRLHYDCPLALKWHLLRPPPLIVASDWEQPPVRVVLP